MSAERYALEAVRDRRVMGTSMAELRKAEAAGFVRSEEVLSYRRWHLTDAGTARIAEIAAEAKS